MLAIGTKEGSGTSFDNYGGELQVTFSSAWLLLRCHVMLSAGGRHLLPPVRRRFDFG